MRRFEVGQIITGVVLVAGIAVLYLFVLSRGRWM